LAVKNARYILTIVPVVSIVAMLAVGVLVDDDDASRIVRRTATFVVDRIPRFLLPARFRPLPLLDQRRAEPVAPTRGGSVYIDAAAVAMAALVLAAQVGANARVSTANLRLYLDDISGLRGRMLESERMKRNASVLNDALAESLAEAIIPDDQTVLVFRQATYGFYASRRFRFHADAQLVDLFRQSDVAGLHRDLIARGIRWVLTPDFALAEINNSAFDPLLRDAARVRPVLRAGGWALFELRTNSDPPALRQLASAAPVASAGKDIYATTDQGAGMVDGRQARLTIDRTAGTAELSRTRGPIKQLNRWDAIVTRPARSGQNPDELNASDFRLSDNNPVLVEAEVSGKGFAEIAVDYVTLLPTPPQRPSISQLEDVSDTEVVVSREVIWSGMLDERARTVGGWLVPPLSRLADGTDRTRRGARLIFRLRDGDRLKLHGWTATSAAHSEAREASARMEAALSGGWSFTRGSANRLRGISLRLPVEKPDRIEDWPYQPIGALRPSTRPITIIPPSFWLPELNRDSPQPTGARRLLEDFVGGAELELRVEAEIGGFGKLAPVLRLSCAGQQSAGGGGLVQTVLGGQQTGERQSRDIEISPAQLWENRVEKLIWRERLPCVPYRARLLLRNEQQLLTTVEEFINDPEVARAGYLDVYGVRMTLVGGATGPNPITVPMRLRRTIREQPAR
jgi:hypothetical protein